MQYRRLGESEIDVSVIALGCWAFAGGKMWGHQEEKDSIETVKAAMDAEINFFDTAEAYGEGRSEEVLGKALKGKRNKAVIATKVSRANLSADDIVNACERSLKRLETDYIDLYQLHWPGRNIPVEESLKAMELLKKQGKIRAVGVSNYGVKDMEEAVKYGCIATNQLAYSLLFRALEYEIKPACKNYGMGILCYSPLMQGLLTGKFLSPDDVPAGRKRTRHFLGDRKLASYGENGFEKETFEAIDKIRNISEEIGQPVAAVSLSWLIHQEAVTSVLAGGRSPEQIAQNVKSADMKLTDEILEKLDKATRPLKDKLGANADMWSDRIK